MSDSPDPLKVAQDAATSGQRFSGGVMDSAQQIWLAGLGALSRTQQEGAKFFDALVEEGVRIQEKTHSYAQEHMQQVREHVDPWVATAKKRTGEAVDKLEQVFDTRIARALERMQMPSQTDIKDLTARVDALARELHATRHAASGSEPEAEAHAESSARKRRGGKRPPAD